MNYIVAGHIHVLPPQTLKQPLEETPPPPRVGPISLNYVIIRLLGMNYTLFIVKRLIE